MKKFENLGFTSTVTRDKVKIEVSIKGLICAFENAPDNEGEIKIKRGKRHEFAEFCAKNIIDECNPHDGATYLHEAFDSMFGLILDGYDGYDLVTDPEDPEESGE